MREPIDYTAFDIPQISQTMFYPQKVWGPPPNGAVDHAVPVAEGITISARFYPRDYTSPTILFFHGNGEIACQYDDIAPMYHEAGANLFVADFRGYGRSGGAPTFSTMIADSRAVYEYFRDYLASAGYRGPRFVKGRSMGCHSAVEIAAQFQGELNGMISESGSGSIDRMAERWGLQADSPALQETVRPHREKIQSIALPLLVIHGEWDELLPVELAIELYDTIGSDDKSLEIVPRAGHNDLLWVGRDQYFEAVRKFIVEHADKSG